MSVTCVINVVCGFYDKMNNGALDPSSKATVKGIKIIEFETMEKAKEEIQKFCQENDIR